MADDIVVPVRPIEADDATELVVQGSWGGSVVDCLGCQRTVGRSG